MHSTKTLTYRVDVKVAFADPCFAGRISECIKSLEFRASERDARAAALKLVEERREALLIDVNNGQITAVYLWPLTLQCRLPDGKVDLRGWLYDRKVLWLKGQGTLETRRQTLSVAALQTHFESQNSAG